MPEYLTTQDAYEHLVDVFNLDGKDTNPTSRKLRRAVTEACRLFPVVHTWNWLQRQSSITTTAPYSTGTVTYVSSTRLLTLTGGIWPTDAAYSHVLISGSRYMVSRRVSGTVLLLAEDSCPAADIADATTYKILRYGYLLPVNCHDVREIADAQIATRLIRVPPSENFYQTEVVGYNGTPQTWTILASRQSPGRKELTFSGVPETSRQYKFFYEPQFGNPLVTELSAGTVSISGDQATFSSAILTDDCIGAVLRISSTSAKPTSAYGVYNSTTKEVDFNPPLEQFIVTARSSTTVATTSGTGTTASGKGYTLSSLIDVPQNPMWDYFLKLCEYKYEMLTRSDTKIQQASSARSQQALTQAQIADAQHMDSRMNGYPMFTRPVVIDS